MLFSFTCGGCESEFTIDTYDDEENSNTATFMALRWAEAHTSCGWTTPSFQADGEPTQFVLSPEDQADEEEWPDSNETQISVDLEDTDPVNIPVEKK